MLCMKEWVAKEEGGGTLNNTLPKNTWGKNGIVHWAEGMPVLLVL